MDIPIARQKLYEQNQCTAEQIESFEKQLRGRSFALLASWHYNIKEKGDKAKLLVLKKYFESIKKENEIFSKNIKIYRDNYLEFFKIFKTPLKKYWLGNAQGFDVINFDAEIVKSGAESMAEVIRSKFGHRAVQLIKELLR